MNTPHTLSSDAPPARPIVHFAHGNSFPGGTYSQFLEHLKPQYDVRATDMFGHDPAYPVTDGWPRLVDQLLAEVQAYGGPVILVGHSLGGMLSLMAAYRRPERVACVVMLDSPVVAGWRALAWRLAKACGWAGKLSPAKLSARRRERWPDTAAVREHFGGKSVFAAFAPGVLDDYLEHGLVPHPEGGVQLRFSRDVESDIYNALPHHLGGLLAEPCPVPIGFIAGTNSVELRQAGMAATRKAVRGNLVTIEGGHLFPLESPAQTAALTLDMIARLLAQRGEHQGRQLEGRSAFA